jgi:hypothetical protein
VRSTTLLFLFRRFLVGVVVGVRPAGRFCAFEAAADEEEAASASTLTCCCLSTDCANEAERSGGTTDSQVLANH